MPHIIIECSGNIEEKNHLAPILKEAQELVEKSLSAKVPGFKNRVIVCDTYSVADGAKDNAFVHMTVKILPGRPREVLDKAAAQLLSFIKKAFHESIKKKKFYYSIEVAELSPTYLKDGPE